MEITAMNHTPATRTGNPGDRAAADAGKAVPVTAGARSRQQGFTIIELLIALAIFGVISAAVFSSYQSQQMSYIKQEKLVEIQQNIRAALFFLERDIRMLGYDPSENAGAGTDTGMIARTGELRFAWDGNEDGTIQNDEYIRFALTNDGNNGLNDAQRDGACGPDSTSPQKLPRCVASVGREDGTGGGLQPVADSVQAIEFLYHFDDGTSSTTCTTQSQRENIRSVDISILVRSREIVRMHTDTAVYFPASNPTRSLAATHWGPFNDNYIRRMMISNIKCRNMGLGT